MLHFCLCQTPTNPNTLAAHAVHLKKEMGNEEAEKKEEDDELLHRPVIEGA